MKKTKFLFDIPAYKDWLFYLFLFSLFINVYNGVSNVVSSGGVVFSSGSLASGLIDAVFRIFFSWVVIIPIYLIRKMARKGNPKVDN